MDITFNTFFAFWVSLFVYCYVIFYRTQDLIWDWGMGLNFDTGMVLYKDDYEESSFLDLNISYVAFQRFFETKGSMDQVYNFLIVKPLLDFSYFVSYKELDKGWLELFFVKTPTFIIFFIAKIFNQNFGSLKLNFLPGIFFLFTIILYIIYLILN